MAPELIANKKEDKRILTNASPAARATTAPGSVALARGGKR
jgi:hypothetical protein